MDDFFAQDANQQPAPTGGGDFGGDFGDFGGAFPNPRVPPLTHARIAAVVFLFLINPKFQCAALCGFLPFGRWRGSRSRSTTDSR